MHKINRIYHRSPMQTEKIQPEGKQIMPETRFTEFPALSVDPRVGILDLHRRPMIPITGKMEVLKITIYG